MAAPTVFGPDKLKADIAADFTAQGISGVELLVGEWNTERHYGEPRVVIGLGRGTFDDPAGMREAGGRWIDIGGSQEARPLLARVQTFPIWVHSRAPDGTAPDLVAQAAREATAALLDATAGAIRRSRGGLATTPWPLEWLNEARGEFVYGSLARLEVPIALLVADAPADVGTADEVELGAQLDEDGTLVPTPPETSVEP